MWHIRGDKVRYYNERMLRKAAKFLVEELMNVDNQGKVMVTCMVSKKVVRGCMNNVT